MTLSDKHKKNPWGRKVGSLGRAIETAVGDFLVEQTSGGPQSDPLRAGETAELTQGRRSALTGQSRGTRRRLSYDSLIEAPRDDEARGVRFRSPFSPKTASGSSLRSSGGLAAGLSGRPDSQSASRPQAPVSHKMFPSDQPVSGEHATKNLELSATPVETGDLLKDFRRNGKRDGLSGVESNPFNLARNRSPQNFVNFKPPQNSNSGITGSKGAQWGGEKKARRAGKPLGALPKYFGKKSEGSFPPSSNGGISNVVIAGPKDSGVIYPFDQEFFRRSSGKSVSLKTATPNKNAKGGIQRAAFAAAPETSPQVETSRTIIPFQGGGEKRIVDRIEGGINQSRVIFSKGKPGKGLVVIQEREDNVLASGESAMRRSKTWFDSNSQRITEREDLITRKNENNEVIGHIEYVTKVIFKNGKFVVQQMKYLTEYAPGSDIVVKEYRSLDWFDSWEEAIDAIAALDVEIVVSELYDMLSKPQYEPPESVSP